MKNKGEITLIIVLAAVLGLGGLIGGAKIRQAQENNLGGGNATLTQIEKWFAGSNGAFMYPLPTSTQVVVGTNATSSASLLESPSLTITGLLNCNTIDTNGGGVLACGTDEGGAGSGISNLNGLTTSTQTFATSTASGTWTVVSSGSTHTFTIPSNVGFFTNDAGYVTSTTAGSGTVSTSSAVTANYFPYWANTAGGLNGTSTIYQSGANVGISTTVPSTTLHIVGTFQVTGAVTFGTALTVANGGTGATTLTDGGVLLGSGTGAITPMSVLANGEIIVGDGTTDPVALAAFTSSTGVLKIANGGTATSTTPAALKVLVGNGTAYDLLTVTGGTGITVATSSTALTFTNSLPICSAGIEFSTTGSTSGFNVMSAQPVGVTSTISSVVGTAGPNNGDSVVFNLMLVTNRSVATSTHKQVFSSYQTLNATTTRQSFTPNGSTTISSADMLFVDLQPASTTDASIRVCFTPQ